MVTQMPLTVAIPTMNRWTGFLDRILPGYLENPLITNVLICDETGNDVNAIQASKWASHPKLTLHVNEKRLGMYANKRECVRLAPTEWVAVLDSDNIFPEDFFETLLAECDFTNTKTVFASSHIVRVFKDTGKSEERTAHFSGMQITRTNWNEVLKMQAWHFLLNDGNWVANKAVLDAWPPLPEDRVAATDSLTIARNFVRGGFTYFIVPGLRYIHTVHDDSEWIKTEQKSSYLLATTDWRL
jgi:hypothetical protein